MLPRLIRTREKYVPSGGGIGTGGPGETKLETDRRHIRNRITIIKRELKEVAAHRDRTVRNAATVKSFRSGLIGYTNAGKSTILNLLTSADTYEARPTVCDVRSFDEALAVAGEGLGWPLPILSALFRTADTIDRCLSFYIRRESKYGSAAACG